MVVAASPLSAGASAMQIAPSVHDCSQPVAHTQAPSRGTSAAKADGAKSPIATATQTSLVFIFDLNRVCNRWVGGGCWLRIASSWHHNVESEAACGEWLAFIGAPGKPKIKTNHFKLHDAVSVHVPMYAAFRLLLNHMHIMDML